jgi:hypothetical protein
MSTISPSSYPAEASALDVRIDMVIADIRRRQDAGELSVVQAADLRIEALSAHLDALRALRREHFGDDE